MHLHLHLLSSWHEAHTRNEPRCLSFRGSQSSLSSSLGFYRQREARAWLGKVTSGSGHSKSETHTPINCGLATWLGLTWAMDPASPLSQTVNGQVRVAKGWKCQWPVKCYTSSKILFPSQKKPDMQGSCVFTALQRIACDLQLNQQPFSQQHTGQTGLITPPPLARGFYHLAFGNIPNLCW